MRGNMNICLNGICTGPHQCIPVDEKRVILCYAWLLHVPRITKRPTTQHHSYYWKHIVEKQCGYYVSNGEFLVACQRRGLTLLQPKMDKGWRGGPYAHVNISLHRVKPDPAILKQLTEMYETLRI